MSVGVRVVAGILAIVLEAVVLDAAIRTFLLPRMANVRLNKWIATVVMLPFRVLSRPTHSYRLRDRVLALYPSFTLLCFQASWLALSVVAFAGAFIAAGATNYAQAFRISGSSLFTLGIAEHPGASFTTLEYVEAGVGLTLLALLIAFIPSLYQSFQRRELSVSRLAVRAGIPATPWGILEVAHSVKSNARLVELWMEWEQWFIDVGETHTTLTILNYYRSPNATQTWISAAASVLDAAALFQSAVDEDPSPSAGLCIRSGWITLRHLADYFKVPYPTTFTPETPVSITRGEFEGVLDRLARAGIPILPDRDAAWSDFAGWRVNYDAIIEDFQVRFACPRIDWRLATAQPLLAPSNQRGVQPRRGDVSAAP